MNHLYLTIYCAFCYRVSSTIELNEKSKRLTTYKAEKSFFNSWNDDILVLSSFQFNIETKSLKNIRLNKSTDMLKFVVQNFDMI